MSKYKGKCSECEHRDVVNKKWWGCTTVVCTFNSQMGKALPATENIPSWCPTGGVPKVKEEENKKSISCDLLIKNMKLPKDGFYEVTICGSGRVFYHPLGRPDGSKKTEAMELPEHGDLIDRDRLAESIEDIGIETGSVVRYKDVPVEKVIEKIFEQTVVLPMSDS